MRKRRALWSVPFVIGLGIGIAGVQLAACGDTPPDRTTSVVQEPPAVASSIAAPAPDRRVTTGVNPAGAESSVADEVAAPTDQISGTTPRRGTALPMSELASIARDLGTAFPEDVLPALATPLGVRPSAISIPSIGVNGAPIEPVGLEPSGDLEVPGATTVGWYEFGAGIDGGRGSSVLAAHIAFNGSDGVFRDLADLTAGRQLAVEGPTGSVTYEVTEVHQYGKADLPIDELFREDGAERVVLITCGGSFNPTLRSYDDNVVVIAVPVDA